MIVTLPNFGDERAVANTLRWADLDAPVLVHAFTDDGAQMTIEHRRDSFCGKMSVCNNLRQYGIPFSLTTLHAVPPCDPTFVQDLERFAATCRVVRSLKHARIGAIGARRIPIPSLQLKALDDPASRWRRATCPISSLGPRRPTTSRREVELAASAPIPAPGIPTLSLMKWRARVAIDPDAGQGAGAPRPMLDGAGGFLAWGVPLMSMMSSRCQHGAKRYCRTARMLSTAGSQHPPPSRLEHNTAGSGQRLVSLLNLPRVYSLNSGGLSAIIAGTVGKENLRDLVGAFTRPFPYVASHR